MGNNRSSVRFAWYPAKKDLVSLRLARCQLNWVAGSRLMFSVTLLEILFMVGVVELNCQPAWSGLFGSAVPF